MTQNNTGWKRALLVALVVMISVPGLMLLISIIAWRASSVTAQEAANRNRAEARIRSVDELAPQPLQQVAPNIVQEHEIAQSPPIQYGPEVQTNLREQIVETYTPTFDPKTGKTIMKKHEQTIRTLAPGYTTQWVRPTAHDPRVIKLANELRSMSDNDEARDGKMRQLRQRLDLEFELMHEKQAGEIENTEKRLDSLRQRHQTRGENQDKIVQRRIDELIGRSDSLQWNPSDVGPVAPSNSPRMGYPTITYGIPPTQTPIGSSGAPIGSSGAPFGPPRSSQFNTRENPSGVTSNRRIETRQERVATRPTQAVPDQRVLTPPPPPKSPADPTMPKRPAQSAALLYQPSTVASPRVEVASTSVLSKLFDLARKSVSAESELATSTVDLEELARLGEQGAVAAGEIRRAEAKVEQLRNEIALNKIEREAFTEAFKRNLEFAKAAMDSAGSRLKIANRRFESGTTPEDEVLKAKFALMKAENEYAAANANLRQLELAFKSNAEKAEAKDDSKPDRLLDPPPKIESALPDAEL